MHRTFETWQVHQLQRLGDAEPQRLAAVMLALFEHFPDLYVDLAIAAVDQGELSIQEAAERLKIPVSEVESKFEAFHQGDQIGRRHVVRIGDVARLINSQITVWEVAREYRLHKSIPLLKASFPSIPTSELQAAIRYAEANPEEIEALITRYETAYAKAPNGESNLLK
jgi:uncharacterized protein (DUF433 family)